MEVNHRLTPVELIARADILDQDAVKLLELAERAKELAEQIRGLGFYLLVHDPRRDTSE